MESAALEVALGIAVVFFLAATVVTAANEAITRFFNVRSKALWATLERLLSTSASAQTKVNLKFSAALAGNNDQFRPASGTAAAERAASAPGAVDLLATTSIASLDYVADGKRTKIWHIPKDVFAAALLELAKIKGAGTDATLAQKVGKLVEVYEGTPIGNFLSSLAVSGATTVDEFTTSVGAWFDGQMQRLTDSYRRLTKYFLAVIGLGVALVFNVDAVAISSGLANNADQRAAVVLLADDLDADGLACKDKTTGLDCAAGNLSSIKNLGMKVPFHGWSDTWKGQAFSDDVVHAAGIGLTALAVSLGGPFWFDTVGALAGLRRRKT